MSDPLTRPGSAGRQVFLYVVEGEASVGGEPVEAQHLIERDREGSHVEIEATSDARLLLGHGELIDEPGYAHGPFVMTAFEEIVQAVEE